MQALRPQDSPSRRHRHRGTGLRRELHPRWNLQHHFRSGRQVHDGIFRSRARASFRGRPETSCRIRDRPSAFVPYRLWSGGECPGPDDRRDEPFGSRFRLPIRGYGQVPVSPRPLEAYGGCRRVLQAPRGGLGKQSPARHRCGRNRHQGGPGRRRPRRRFQGIRLVSGGFLRSRANWSILSA